MRDIIGAGGPGRCYFVCCAEHAGKRCWKRPGIFLGVYSSGQAREVNNLTSLKLSQFVFPKITATLTVGLIFEKWQMNFTSFKNANTHTWYV